jgi:hypothetical protein
VVLDSNTLTLAVSNRASLVWLAWLKQASVFLLTLSLVACGLLTYYFEFIRELRVVCLLTILNLFACCLWFACLLPVLVMERAGVMERADRLKLTQIGCSYGMSDEGLKAIGCYCPNLKTFACKSYIVSGLAKPLGWARNNSL